ncbi:hypothetical protein GIB67_009603 [Kingdonia uniflora]|uniref:Cation/H+ exchanger domain-containing protein n=1 Tax=Kingdonia uniflora TaxID=39325 RepID=A0A7J7MN48_9MAGN|nr:hypothetical protein GIB67_009603 [Kingdonia uniflora]
MAKTVKIKDGNFGMADALQNAMQKDEPKFTDPIRGEMVCFASSMKSTNGVWQGDDPFEYSLPLFILQLMLIVVITRILIFLLKPLRQPKVISEILGGVILGPSILGRSANFSAKIFPLRSIMVLETLANVGLLFFLFLVGVEMDLGMIRKTSQKAMVIAIASFPVLVRILAELKLLNTEIGKIAMSAAMMNDICAIGFVLMLIFVVRPGIEWFIHRITNGESFSDYHICLILTGVFVCGFITDAIGTHSIFGAFVLGLIIPKGPLATTLLEKLEDFVTTLLLPLYFAISGLRTDISSVNGKGDYGFFIAIIVLACVGKVAGTLLNALYYKMPFREAFVLALLMNTKGLTEMVVLNVGLSIHPLTAISPYSTMHEDICNLAEDERVTFIILPFHKQQAVDGGMEATNPVLRNINQNVLANAPCSVGILIDRGLGGLTRVAVSQISCNIAVLFFGGPDDREALSYAWRMARHPGVSLTVFRFLPGEDAVKPKRNYDNFTNGRSNLNIVTEIETERLYDDKYITDFRLQNVSDETIVYTEKFINNAEETVVAVRSMENIHDLYIVGRGQGMISPLIASLNDWSECPELGAIGDLLASSDSATTISVLVVQQYVGGSHGDGLRTPDSQLTDNYDNLQSDTLPPSSSKGDSSPFHLGRINNNNNNKSWNL